jgi:hypothetical protein
MLASLHPERTQHELRNCTVIETEFSIVFLVVLRCRSQNELSHIISQSRESRLSRLIHTLYSGLHTLQQEPTPSTALVKEMERHLVKMSSERAEVQ